MKMEQKVCFWEQIEKNGFSTGGFKMRIAICDPDKDFLLQFKNKIYRYAEETKIEIVVERFVLGENILNSDCNYNLIFLGHDLKGITDIETAIRLREAHNNTPIIFISDCTDFIFDAFKVRAYGFLLKEHWESRIFSVLDDFFKKMGDDYPIWIKNAEDTVCLTTGDIYYLEADNKHCYIHLKNSSLYCNKTMAQVFKVLPKSHFLKTNRAFIVNLNHISRYNNDIITLKNGKTLHPSRNYYKTFKEEYRRFLRPLEL